jgi:hypothetical protein
MRRPTISEPAFPNPFSFTLSTAEPSYGRPGSVWLTNPTQRHRVHAQSRCGILRVRGEFDPEIDDLIAWPREPVSAESVDEVDGFRRLCRWRRTTVAAIGCSRAVMA